MRYTSLAMLSATLGVMVHYFITGQYGLSDLYGNMILYGLLLAIVADGSQFYGRGGYAKL